MSEAAVSEAPSAAPKSKMVPMMLIVNTLLVTGVLLFTMTRKQSAAPAAPAAEPAAGGEHGAAPESKGHGAATSVGGMGPTLHLETFIVQLKALDAERYAHLGIDVEVGGEDDKTKITGQLPRVRDAIIMYLSDRTADELRGSEGMGHLKEELLTRLRALVPSSRIGAVLITDFIVQ